MSVSASINTADKVNLLGLDREKLTKFFADIGEKAFRAHQLIQWVHTYGVTDFQLMTNMSKSLREKLERCATITPPEIQDLQISNDGTRKWLFKVPGGSSIETVYIPEAKRATLCISSQVGCALNCKFCSTAQQGFQRNLSSHEIIGQLWIARHHLAKAGIVVEDGRSVTNVVMMGMGEPLLNLDNLFPALNLMRDDLAYGFSKRRITDSTSGVIPGIDELAKKSDVALALSLHAPTDELRETIIPLNKKYNIKQLMDACKRYLGDDKRRRVTMEYIMLKGINDSPEHARQLIKVLSKVPSKINLIPFNPFPNAIYTCTEYKDIIKFRDILMQAGIVTMVRKTRGEDIDAACGQLAGKVLDRTMRSKRIQIANQQVAQQQ